MFLHVAFKPRVGKNTLFVYIYTHLFCFLFTLSSIERGDLNIEDVFSAVWSLRGSRWLTLVNLTLLVKWSLGCLVTRLGERRERWRDWERQSETGCQEMTGRRVDGVLSWDLRRSFLDLLPSKSEKCHWKLWSLSLKTETLCKCLLQLYEAETEYQVCREWLRQKGNIHTSSVNPC